MYILTCATHGPDGVLIKGEALLQGVTPHVLVEHIAPGEVEKSTEILIMRNQPAKIQYDYISSS